MITGNTNKKIPWQDSENIFWPKAFFLTWKDVFLNPVDYFERLDVGRGYYDPITFCMINAICLSGPLIVKMPQVAPWVGVFCVVFVTPALAAFLALINQSIFQIWGGKSEGMDFVKGFYVFAYSSPAFLFVFIPMIGYGVSALAFIILAGIGLSTVFNVHYNKIFLTLIFTPMIIFVPFKITQLTDQWRRVHPVVDTQLQAKKILAAISIAAENYALAHDGRYPSNSSSLVDGPVQYLAEDYCGYRYFDYAISCDFRSFGYFVRAQPQGWTGKGKKVFVITTGGKLREK